MTPSQGNGKPGFKLSIPAVVFDEIKKLGKEAVAAGVGPAFVAALKRINERLQRDPRNFGEARYHLKTIRQTIFQAAVAPLVVSYSVHEDHPIVFVRWFKLLS